MASQARNSRQSRSAIKNTKGGRDEDGRRDELARVAAELFRNRGYDATTMQEVADAMGILKGSVYHYVRTKEDLLWMVVEEPLHELVANAREIFSTKDLSASASLTLAIEAHAVAFERHYPHMFVITRENGETLSPARRTEFDSLRAEYFKLFRRAVTQGMKTDDLRPDIDPSLTVYAIFGMLNWMFRWFSPGRRADAADVAAAFSDILIAGIKR